MQPRFRSDLKCSREEQQGVVFYRIDDPKSQTSFRLYEIEYLIAQKLDGTRPLTEVIGAVKNEYNFDISEPDLTKFVSQLDSMGFIEKEGDGEPVPNNDPTNNDDTKVMQRSDVQIEGDAESQADVIDDIDLVETSAPPIDEAELKRLLKSALLHVRQGYIVHARDYFLAAKELNPTDSRLAKLVSHLEIIGDSSGPAEVDYLWSQARELYPELAEEVAPLAETKSATAGPSHEAHRKAHGRDSDLRTRLIWLAVLIILVGGIAGGLYYFVTANHLFEGAAKATVVSLRSQRLPIYYEAPAETVRAARETWLPLPVAGKIADVTVTRDTRVQAEQVLVALAQPAALDKQMQAAQVAIKKLEDVHTGASAKLDQLVKERAALEAERDAVDSKLEQLKVANLTTQAGAQKRELDKLKKARAKANNKLSQLTKRERAPKASEVRAQKKLEQAQKKLATLRQQVARKQIAAPYAGVIIDVAVQAGQTVTAQQKAVLIRDNSEVNLTFAAKQVGQLVAGAEAFVSVARGVPSQAKIAAVAGADGDKHIQVTLADPAGSFVDMRPQEFRLVREFIERAFEIPASAIISDDRGTRVLVDVSGRALARPVEVVSRNAASVIIREKSGALRDGERVVVERIGGDGGVASIVDGSFLEVP